MQVVSGRIDRPRVHFEAPPRKGLENRIAEFLAWFNASRREAALDPLLRAAIAHFWFVTLHPFDDGNGRIARALTDLALAQGEQQSIRFYAMSVAILADRKGYYRQLESAQKMASAKQPVDITPWLQWFLATLQEAIVGALAQIDRVLGKSRFWLLHREQSLGPEQRKVLNRLLDGDQPERGGFAQGISAAQYQAVTQVSKATATRHLADLVAKGCLIRMPGGGRNTRYRIHWPAAGEPRNPGQAPPWEPTGYSWRRQASAVTPEQAHQRLDAGAVGEDRQRYDNERELDKFQGQVFGDAVLDGIHQVVQRADPADGEPADHAAYGPRRAGAEQADKDAGRARRQEQEQRESYRPPAP
jgi:hypothetical protein